MTAQGRLPFHYVWAEGRVLENRKFSAIAKRALWSQKSGHPKDGRRSLQRRYFRLPKMRSRKRNILMKSR